MISSWKKELVSGVYYTAIAKYSGLVVQLLIVSILARLLTPEDFGVVAIATVFIAFFSIFSDSGIAAAIVQKNNLSFTDYSQLFSFSLILGAFLSFIFYLGANLIGGYYKSELLTEICKILSVSLFFTAINVVPNALLLKARRFKFIALRTIILQIIGGLLSIVAACQGMGVYTLLISPIFTSIFIFVLSYLQYSLPFTYRLSLEPIKKIFSYSSYQLLFSIECYFARNIDKILIGKFLGMNLLGYYEKSYRLMLLPVQNLTHVLTPVLHPIFSQLQDNITDMAGKYMKIIYYMSLLAFPLSVLLYFISKELVLVFFGPQWMNAVPAFKILSLSVGFQILLSTTGSILQASNSTKRMFIVGSINSLIVIFAILVSVIMFQSVKAVASFFLLGVLLNFMYGFYATLKVLNYSLITFFSKIYRSFLISIILFFILYVFSLYVHSNLMIVSLILKGCVFVLFYVVCIFVCEKCLVRNIIYHLKRR